MMPKIAPGLITDRSGQTLIDSLLADQQKLTPVERLSAVRAHGA